MSVQDQLAEEGRCHGIKIANRLIAAPPEAAGPAILHHDHDFDVIAEVTGQHAEWIVPAGPVP